MLSPSAPQWWLLTFFIGPTIQQMRCDFFTGLHSAAYEGRDNAQCYTHSHKQPPIYSRLQRTTLNQQAFRTISRHTQNLDMADSIQQDRSGLIDEIPERQVLTF